MNPERCELHTPGRHLLCGRCVAAVCPEELPRVAGLETYTAPCCRCGRTAAAGIYKTIDLSPPPPAPPPPRQGRLFG